MISVWMIYYMMMKATLMDREADGKELNEGCSTTKNCTSSSVTMETTEQSELPIDCEMEVAVADSPEQGKDFSTEEEVCLGSNSSDSPGEKAILGTLLTDLQTGGIDADKSDYSETNIYTEMPCLDQNEVSISESGHEELNRNESITSSVSDTPSSADSVYENEAHRKRQDTPEQDPEQEQVPELQQCPEPDPKPEQYHEKELDPEPEQYPEHENNLDVEHYPEPDTNLDMEHYPEPDTDLDVGQYPEPDTDLDVVQYTEPDTDLDVGQYPEPDTDLDMGQYPEPDTNLDMGQYPEHEDNLEVVQYPEHEDNLEVGQYPEPELDCDLESYPNPEQDPELELYTEPEAEANDNEFKQKHYGYKNLPVNTEEDPVAHDILLDPPITEESILEHCIREEAMSDMSNESCHDLDPDEMDECLRVEIAAASSDSETDEKWRSIFSSSINKEDDDSYLDSLQLSAQELFVQKVDVTDFEEEDNIEEACCEVPQVEEVLEQPEDIIPFPAPTQEVKYNPLGTQGLSKISEDESENGRDANHNHTAHQEHINADQNKKLPKDFCVIQETKSENVSTEHVDFQLARKQWREMEEHTKNKIVLPTAKQPSFHGSHSFMYTPVRNIERTQKKTHDLESLNLVGDYPHTQFSPCSEDSGLDDSSYRSPYDDPETPIEREIRISMEREENFRRERGLSRMGKSTDCAPSRSLPRSISTPLTPSFIITSSPTKEPLKHEVSANNVIILDPSNDFTPSPRYGKDNVVPRPGEWRSEDNRSNLIILETTNLIIRSASDFSLNKACEQPQEKTFLNNPFFKLRSRSTISFVDEEIKLVKQREEDLKKERSNLYGQDRFNAERMLSNHMDTLSFETSADVPLKCKSSPSSPMKTAYRMDRSALSCDHRFPEIYAGGRRKSAMALRWEAGEFSKND
ncbi:uncharacterized protein palmdb isoform X2 [Paralichthys olivaceus]|uniref:uncharacterized protein palmdb isoform X2 n=1 Tax=Paralichthys olivaceus TaxID=8255 RepID=UPI003750CDB4